MGFFNLAEIVNFPSWKNGFAQSESPLLASETVSLPRIALTTTTETELLGLEWSTNTPTGVRLRIVVGGIGVGCVSNNGSAASATLTPQNLYNFGSDMFDIMSYDTVSGNYKFRLKHPIPFNSGVVVQFINETGTASVPLAYRARWRFR